LGNVRGDEGKPPLQINITAFPEINYDGLILSPKPGNPINILSAGI
jgi:hypothetical protein